MKKIKGLLFFGAFLPLWGMNQDKGANYSFDEPCVFITEIHNTTQRDYLLAQKGKAFSYIKAGQKLSVYKKLSLDRPQEGKSSMVWWQLEDVYLSMIDNRIPLASINFSIIVTQAGRSFTSFTSLLTRCKESPNPKRVDESSISNCLFDGQQDRYHVNIQLALEGDELQDSTMDVVHVLQPKFSENYS